MLSSVSLSNLCASSSIARYFVLPETSRTLHTLNKKLLLKVHQKLSQFEGRSLFTTWITRIARNEALMCLRKPRGAFDNSLEDLMQDTDISLAKSSLQSALEGPEAAYLRKELTVLLTCAIAGLQHIYRGVFVLRGVQQLSAKETTQALHISSAAVKARMRRARIKLQNCFLQREAKR